MTAQRFVGIVEKKADHWAVTVSNVGHKRQQVLGHGTTRDAAIRDAKASIARLLNVRVHDVTLTTRGD